MTTFKLPNNYDPHAIIKLIAENQLLQTDNNSPDVMETFNTLRTAYKLSGPILSGNRIDIVNGIWDVFTPLLISGFFKLCETIVLRRDKELINHFIEHVGNNPADLEDVTCTLMVLSFIQPCFMALKDDDRHHYSMYGPIMMVTSIWKRLTEGQSIVETLQTDLLRKREKIFGNVHRLIALNIYAFLMNVAALTSVLDQHHLNDYLRCYSINKDSQLENFCYLLDVFSFSDQVPFWGGKKFRSFFISCSETKRYLNQKYGSSELIKSYTDEISAISKKLKKTWEGNLLDGSAWAQMHEP